MNAETQPLTITITVADDGWAKLQRVAEDMRAYSRWDAAALAPA